MPIKLHDQLQADCITLGRIDSSLLLLHKNALVPWFILIPDTHENELYKLDAAQQTTVQKEINAIALFIEQHFDTDKLNIATLGNIVPQLHVHIIGRYVNDFCWPNPVWGQTESKPYSPADVASLRQHLLERHLLKEVS